MNPAGSILLADDHGPVRHGLPLLIAEVLPQRCMELAGSLPETVPALQTPGRSDLVLLDLMFSDVHDLAGRHWLREEFPHVPVVILSTQEDRDTVLTALDADGSERSARAGQVMPPSSPSLATLRGGRVRRRSGKAGLVAGRSMSTLRFMCPGYRRAAWAIEIVPRRRQGRRRRD